MSSPIFKDIFLLYTQSMKNNGFINTIHTFVTKHTMLDHGSTVVIGLSGGPDSVFLLHFLSTYYKDKNRTLITAHLDHGWRQESAQDVAFCQQLAEQYQVPFITARLTDLNLSIKFNGSQEEIGRKARRHFLEKVARDHGAKAIALAHHTNDQQETFFLRLIRGASLTGLIGIKPKQGLYIRPLLEVKKADIVAYLQQHSIAYLTDPSNNADIYLRNRIRNTVLPSLYAADSRFETTFKSTLTQLQETESFLQDLAEQTFAKITHQDTVLWIHNAQFLQLHPILRNRIVVLWLCKAGVPFTPTQAFLQEIERFMGNSHSNEHHIKHDWKLCKKNGHTAIQLRTP